jgi:hypothetical protein
MKVRRRNRCGASVNLKDNHDRSVKSWANQKPTVSFAYKESWYVGMSQLGQNQSTWSVLPSKGCNVAEYRPAMSLLIIAQKLPAAGQVIIKAVAKSPYRIRG